MFFLVCRGCITVALLFLHAGCCTTLLYSVCSITRICQITSMLLMGFQNIVKVDSLVMLQQVICVCLLHLNNPITVLCFHCWRTHLFCWVFSTGLSAMVIFSSRFSQTITINSTLFNIYRSRWNEVRVFYSQNGDLSLKPYNFDRPSKVCIAAILGFLVW